MVRGLGRFVICLCPQGAFWATLLGFYHEQNLLIIFYQIRSWLYTNHRPYVERVNFCGFSLLGSGIYVLFLGGSFVRGCWRTGELSGWLGGLGMRLIR